jgi:hypothetical protein
MEISNAVNINQNIYPFSMSRISLIPIINSYAKRIYKRINYLILCNHIMRSLITRIKLPY